MPSLVDFLIIVIKAIVVLGALMLAVAYATWLERKIVGHIQVRLGPMRVGWHGLLQPIADGIKLFFKEDIIPLHADKLVYLLAPVISITPALVNFSVIPFGDSVTVLGRKVDMVIADVNVGILVIIALGSIGVYGIVLAGWSSNSKYSLLGGMRSMAQMISYELSLGLSLVGVLMLTRSLSLVDVVNAQARVPFILLQPLGFLIFLCAAVAETNRAPFDLPEAEQELVAGFHTEYSSMKFALFFLGEYAAMITVSALATTFFLGGWRGPILPPVLWFLIKVFCFLFFYIWIRGTLPRLRYDQLMAFGWKVLLPAALANIVITGGIITIMGF